MIRKALLALSVIAVLVAWKIWSDTMSDPVIERLVLTSDELPAGSAPVTIALVADIHMGGPDMPPERVAKIVAQANALGADIIAIAGDLVSEKRSGTKVYTPQEVIAPLGGLEAPIGVALVPGNHDHWYDWPALSRELARFPQITVLQNEALQFGPLALGGVDDDFTSHDDVPATLEAMYGLTGPRVILTHSPDIFPDLPASITLVMAGHTHCGQIAYPWGGSPAQMSRYGNDFACGVVEDDGKTLVTSSGLGTSILPLRLFTHPEIWLIEIRPAG
ncbi:MAG: metallophosphoesterase [Erythrobacter sp.]|jgi:predicted MPP superfamily phosphohydrolase|nr:metallophosphoesterase [Erythrobacter sp.]